MTRAWITASLVLALSLSLKVIANPAWSGEAAPTPRTEVLRRFLASATQGPLEAIPAPPSGEGGEGGGGWRFRSGACQASAFP